MKRDLLLFIEDILENINLIESSTKVARDKFDTNRLLIDATIRRLEIIGEATKNIPDSLRNKYPEIPWKKIAGFRDVIIHGYFGINFDRVWEIINKDISTLKSQIQKVKDDLDAEEKKKVEKISKWKRK